MAFNTLREKFVQLFDRVKIKKSLVVTGPVSTGIINAGGPIYFPSYSGRLYMPSTYQPSGWFGQSGDFYGVGGASLFAFSSHINGTYQAVEIFCVQDDARAGLSVASYGQIGFSSVSAATNTNDVVFRRDAADTLAQRRTTNAQTSRLYATYTSATSYHRMALTCAKQTLSAVSGATVATTGGLIPAGAFLMGVTTRVNTSLGVTNGTTGYAVGTATDPNLWGDVTAVADGTASKASAITDQSSGYTASDALGLQLTAQDVTLTATGGNFDATGEIEISAFYFLAEAD